MISEVDENMSGAIDFGEFLKVIEKQKERASRYDDESDMGSFNGNRVRERIVQSFYHVLVLGRFAARMTSFRVSNVAPPFPRSRRRAIAVDAFVACGGMRECKCSIRRLETRPC